ncbi:MAG: hypothetical protein ACKO96_24555 [Flammeovirgaceae bacterium]
MKRLKTITVATFRYTLPLVFLSILSCENLYIDPSAEGGGKKTQCITVSYSKWICREAVLKIEDPAFYGMGETWDGEDHVFFTVLGCDINVETLMNKKFKVLVSDKDNSSGNCITCQATLAYTGSKKYFITLCN